MNYYENLENILINIISKVKKQDFLVFFRKISILEIKENTLYFWVLSSFMKENLNAKFYKEILESTKMEFNFIEKIEFKVDSKIENPNNKNVIDCTDFYKKYSKKIKLQKKEILWSFDDSKKSYINDNDEYTNNSKGLSSRYTMENFIVWPSNQLAYSASEAVIKNPWKSYNPLYIYWDVWLWKTHLLQWTWNAILKKYKDKKVKYMTADSFINEYVQAVKKKSVDKLRIKYGEIDVLIIDDVQFLSKKEQTQNELYNIFNIMYDAEKQIIISWDKPPKELEQLEPRLRSRFEWWIIVDISKPDFETRLAILQEKARAKEFMIPQDVAEFIAANVNDNIRELEWVLNQLIAEYELDWVIPTIEKVAKKLEKLSFTIDMIWESKLKQTTKIKSYKDVIKAVSDHFWIEVEWILWESRKKEFMIPRQVAMYLLKNKLHYTYERIGNIFYWRNHRSVLYNCNKLEIMLKKDKNLLHEINILRDSIGL